MIPFILAIAGGYLIGNASETPKFAKGGKLDAKVKEFIMLQIRANKELHKNGEVSQKTADELDRVISSMNSHEAEIAIEEYAKMQKKGVRYSFGEGGSIEEQNNLMLQSNVKEIKHHAEELENIVSPDTKVDAWVVAKAERSASDLSDITHYLDGKQQ